MTNFEDMESEGFANSHGIIFSLILRGIPGMESGLSVVIRADPASERRLVGGRAMAGPCRVTAARDRSDLDVTDHSSHEGRSGSRGRMSFRVIYKHS